MSKEKEIKGSACFYCENSIQGSDGFTCELELDNSHLDGGINTAILCENVSLQYGFKIWDRYTHMTIKKDGHCLEWNIKGDGRDPQELPENQLFLHICDFEELEKFVKFWREQIDRGNLKPVERRI